ncbi:SpoIIE family protein phosphatase [Alkalilimnicola ehrlichii MLHE-1]|uniref:Serine phosphatase n=1 Tax=Alkalilimnicola ehrlichii (strain ATCC BAA-1101 / DSM 17681 / MLHE-1) TaxID=187272 RepID=Q0A9X1_ALKEH|nr:SpoIIE family protein phosphatase [Alkalilimnicola ehrlichii]ABI56366.1 serine phosphatase [Alkalilimnicola ehrlichii MLHE-1]
MQEAAAPGRRVSRGLTFKQAVTTLVVVFLLGVLAAAVEIYADWRSMRDEVRTHMQQTLAMVEGSAVDAAFNLNPDGANQIARGLAEYEFIQRVELHDNFGDRLALYDRPRALNENGMAGRLFDDLSHWEVELIRQDIIGRAEPVGELRVRLDPEVIAAGFVHRTAVNAGVNLIKALAISLLVVAIFHFLITRPLLRLNTAIAGVDPAHPGDWSRPGMPGHQGDELGQIVGSLDRLLGAFQKGLNQRDQAEGELKALTEELEQRVQDRTRKLQDAMDELAAEKEETEAAYGRLNEAHRELERANRLVVESIRYARRIQTAMLPDKSALGDAVQEIHVCWEPLHLVGGDYFWLERFGRQSLIVVVDCTGHGVPGAFITLVVASALDRILHERDLRSPAEILTALDEMVRARLRQDGEEPESDDGLDASICLWDEADRSVTFSGAGLPLIYVEDGEAHEIKGNRAGLGYHSLVPRKPFVDHRVPVKPGMSFYQLTDGIPDHMGGEPRRLLGRRRVRRLIARNAHLPMAEQIQRLEAELERYRGPEPRRDDMTLVGFRPL